MLGRAFYIQRIQGKYWTGMSDSLHLKYMPINAERGSIYSEDGNMLSTSIPVFNIYIDFGADGLREKFGKRFYDNIDSLSISLAAFLMMHQQRITKNNYHSLIKMKTDIFC